MEQISVQDVLGALIVLTPFVIQALKWNRKRHASHSGTATGKTAHHVPASADRKAKKAPASVVPFTATPPPLPQEGERITGDAPGITPAPARFAEDDATEAHRQRWRRAVIDAEILTPKF